MPLKKSGLISFLFRHWAAAGYVFRVLLPVILRTRRRPVIFSRGTGLGDIICTVPAARELMNRHPGATFIYNCHPSFATIPKLAGVANHVTWLEPIGLIGHWYAFLLAGFYHFAHGDDSADGGCNELMVTEFCRQFNLPLHENHPALTAGAAAKENAGQILAAKNLSLDPLILLHPGPSWPVKEWPYEKWGKLVSGLRQDGFTNIAQLGVGHYMNFGKVEVPVIPGAVSLLDAFTVEECIAAIAQARLFIGIDSGLLHIAASTRTPAVGIWGPTSPRYFFPTAVRKNFIVSQLVCAGCEHRKPRLHWVTNCPYDIKCMELVDVDVVLNACRATLKTKD